MFSRKLLLVLLAVALVGGIAVFAVLSRNKSAEEAACGDRSLYEFVLSDNANLSALNDKILERQGRFESTDGANNLVVVSFHPDVSAETIQPLLQDPSIKSSKKLC